MKKYLLLLTTAILLSACSSSRVLQEQVGYKDNVQQAAAAERLGTQWGDEVSSPVTTVHLNRLTEEPITQTQILYADKAYHGRAINAIALAAGKIDFSVKSDNASLPLYRDNGRYYLQGKAGQAYRLVYHNNSKTAIYEVVASVDGLDVLDGSKASRYNRGYVLKPNATLVIEGFRKSDDAVASFIFSKPADAYAANTAAGSVNNTGIIGTAIYELYNPVKGKLQAFPADENKGYAPAPQ